MHANDVRMYAADVGSTLSHFDVDWTRPSALVIGGEARGLGVDTRIGIKSDQVMGVSIPLARGVESLNAAVAGAVVLGESQRQRALAARLAGVDGRLEANTQARQ